MKDIPSIALKEIVLSAVVNFKVRYEMKYNPIKLIFFANEEFLRFSLLSWVILLSMIFYICNKTLKLNSNNRKTKKIKCIGLAPGKRFNTPPTHTRETLKSSS